MRTSCAIILAGLFTLSCLAPYEVLAEGRKKKLSGGEKPRIILAYAKQTSRVSINCFPGKLRTILTHIAWRTGRRPIVTSGHRPHKGRRGSYHRKCMAADIRIPGVSTKKIVAAARSAPGIGGIGTYCNGIVHVDIGPKRRWSHC
ncbi:MAG: DUF882 domain-containing protein [Shinella sp.]|nr:DUF882 domain-containing protein [Shinella sp.]